MGSQGKVWFVTGTSSGFGRAIVEEAVRRGDRVVASAREPAAVQDLVTLAPDRVRAVKLDVTKPSEIERAVTQALAGFGTIDVLVNNAGFSIVGAVEETTDRALRETMETMFFGAVALTRALLPHFRQRRSGTVVQITSVGGLITAPGFGAYSAAKHALEAVSETLAAEVAPFGIRVLIVEPGAFRTALFGSRFVSLPSMPEYEATVGATRAYAAGSDGAQPGDPAKAAKAIVEAVAAGAPNLRLPLGADAVKSIRDKLARVAGDIDAAETVASATTFG